MYTSLHASILQSCVCAAASSCVSYIRRHVVQLSTWHAVRDQSRRKRVRACLAHMRRQDQVRFCAVDADSVSAFDSSRVSRFVHLMLHAQWRSADLLPV